MDNILYFPHINVPPSDWTIRALLYYEKMGAIVPNEFAYNRDKFDPFMRKLIDNSLVIPINPLEVLNNPWGITDSFLSYIDTLDTKKVRIDRFRATGVQNMDNHEKIDDRYLAWIHREKFEYQLLYRLEEMGLAVKSSGEWFIVEKKTADELMTFVASVLGVKLNYLPTTSEAKWHFFKPFGIERKHYRSYISEQNKREFVLESLIPVPEEIDLKKIENFKQKYSKLLKQFKNRVEQLTLDKTLEAGDELLGQKIEELKLQKEEISTRLNESKLGSRVITAASVISSTGGLLSESNMGIALGAIGLAASIAQAVKNETESPIDQSGLKYLALVDKELRQESSTWVSNWFT